MTSGHTIEMVLHVRFQFPQVPVGSGDTPNQAIPNQQKHTTSSSLLNVFCTNESPLPIKLKNFDDQPSKMNRVLFEFKPIQRTQSFNEAVLYKIKRTEEMERQSEREYLTRRLKKPETFTKICSEYNVNRNAEIAMTMEELRSSLVPVDPATLLTNQSETQEQPQPKKRARKAKDPSKKVTRKRKDPTKKKDTDSTQEKRKRKKSDTVIAWDDERNANVPLVVGLKVVEVDVEDINEVVGGSNQSAKTLIASTKGSEKSVEDEIISAIIAEPSVPTAVSVDSTNKQVSIGCTEMLVDAEKANSQVEAEEGLVQDFEMDSLVPDQVTSQNNELETHVPDFSSSTVNLPFHKALNDSSKEECDSPSPESECGSIAAIDTTSLAESEDLARPFDFESQDFSSELGPPPKVLDHQDSALNPKEAEPLSTETVVKTLVRSGTMDASLPLQETESRDSVLLLLNHAPVAIPTVDTLVRSGTIDMPLPSQSEQQTTSTVEYLQPVSLNRNNTYDDVSKVVSFGKSPSMLLDKFFEDTLFGDCLVPL